MLSAVGGVFFNQILWLLGFVTQKSLKNAFITSFSVNKNYLNLSVKVDNLEWLFIFEKTGIERG